MNLPLAGVSGVRKGYAQRGEIQVRLRVQRANEPECEEFEKLLVRLVEFLHLPDSQYYLILVPKDLEDERFITSSAVMHQVFERFGDRGRRAGNASAVSPSTMCTITPRFRDHAAHPRGA